MKMQIEVDETDLKKLVLAKVNTTLPEDQQLTMDSLTFQVKSKNNYRSQEWETGTMRVVVQATL